MENIIYQKDYRKEFEVKFSHEAKQWNGNSVKPSEKQTFFRFLDAVLSQIPEVIIEEDKENYDRLLHKADIIAWEHGGMVYGIIDYTRYEAGISLMLPSMTFASSNELDFLQDAAASAYGIYFEDIPNDRVTVMNLAFNYFEKADVKYDQNVLYQMMQTAADTVGILFSEEIWEKTNSFFKRYLKE